MKYFGTDGIRGVAYSELDFALAYNAALSFAKHLEKLNNNSKVIYVGKDTRESGDYFVEAIASGLCDGGYNPHYVKIVPTAAISFFITKFHAAGGVMITASHNSAEYNGIKFFGDNGLKLDKSAEQNIELFMAQEKMQDKEKGKVQDCSHLVLSYMDFFKDNLDLNLENIKIAIDCANGSLYKIASIVLKNYGAEVTAINTSNDGSKINLECGALFTSNLQKTVLHNSCEYGFAFDGDADRLIVIAKDCQKFSGDELIFLFADYLKEKNTLENNTVVGTVMTNLGMENSLKKLGVVLHRTDVGDSNVCEYLYGNNLSVGGENSGHICLSKILPTCDALLSCLFFLKIVTDKNYDYKNTIKKLKLSHQTNLQINVNKEFKQNFAKNILLQKKLQTIKEKNENIKILIRPSGTEDVLRIMVDGEENISKKIAFEVKSIIQKCL